MSLSRHPKIIVTRGAASADLQSDHALHHERVPISPQSDGFVDVHERGQKTERRLHGRLVTINRNEKRSLNRLRQQPPTAPLVCFRENFRERRDRALDILQFAIALFRRDRRIGARQLGIASEMVFTAVR